MSFVSAKKYYRCEAIVTCILKIDLKVITPGADHEIIILKFYFKVLRVHTTTVTGY